MNKIWSRDYEVGDYWNRADLRLIIGQPFQLVIEAVVGKGYAGDIAIDDTSFTPGCALANIDLVTVTTPTPSVTTPNPCEVNGQFMCLENNQCINKTKVCDFNIDCPTPGGSDEAQCGTCTFDANGGSLCGWKDQSIYDLEWQLKSGSMSYGPNGDHTTGTGYYVAVAETDDYGFASIRTPPVGPSSGSCQLKFWYYMDFDEDSEYSTISIYFRNEDDGFFSFQYIERITESTGPQWKQAVISIGRRDERFEIGMLQIDRHVLIVNKSFILEIDGSPSEYNAIAMDDTEFFNCQTTTPPVLGYYLAHGILYKLFAMHLSFFLFVDYLWIVPLKKEYATISMTQRLISNGKERTQLHPRRIQDPVLVSEVKLSHSVLFVIIFRSYNWIWLLHFHRSIVSKVFS